MRKTHSALQNMHDANTGLLNTAALAALFKTFTISSDLSLAAAQKELQHLCWWFWLWDSTKRPVCFQTTPVVFYFYFFK